MRRPPARDDASTTKGHGLATLCRAPIRHSPFSTFRIHSEIRRRALPLPHHRPRTRQSESMDTQTLVLLLLGLVLLVGGAEALVRGASRLAAAVGISPLVIGLTVVAFGTSAPEMAVSVGAVLGGRTDIAVGNVVGSNVFNILLILGVSALIIPLVVNVQLRRQEVPIMIGACVLLLVLALVYVGSCSVYVCDRVKVHSSAGL